MLFLDRVLLTRRAVQRQFPTIKGWAIERLRERGKEERKANQVMQKKGQKALERTE